MTMTDHDFETQVAGFADRMVSAVADCRAGQIGILNAAARIVAALSIEGDDAEEAAARLITAMHQDARELIQIVREHEVQAIATEGEIH